MNSDITTQLYEFEPIFKRAVIAAALSPRLSAVLNEACSFLRLLGTHATIVNIGEDGSETREKIETAIHQSFFKDYAHSLLIHPGQPAEGLLEIAARMKADLVIAGALGKEGLVKYVMGSTARRIAWHAPCSVLLFIDPQVQPRTIQNIHCAVEYDRKAQSAVKIAAQLAMIIDVNNMYFTHTFRMPKSLELKKDIIDSKKIIRMYQREDQHLKNYLSRHEFYGHSFQTQCLLERNKSVTLTFTKEVAADLFILPGPRNNSNLWDRLIRIDQEFSLQNLPCSTLLTR